MVGDDFIISSDKATSVALVINELIQNAVHYAFSGRTKKEKLILLLKRKLFSLK